LKKLLNQLSGYRLLQRLFIGCIVAFASTYLILLAIVGIHAKKLLSQPVTAKYDAALILGNRTYLNGAPNPCLIGRVDKGLLLAEQGVVATLAMTGGRDSEDFRIEGEFMAAYAKEKGYQGPILIEARSSSTKENLEFSAPILKAGNIKSVIIVSEPYHLWRTKKLVQASHLGQDFNVTYAAAPTACWTTWGMLFKGALREPLAIMNNYAKGYFSKNLTP
jgi:uncharacterized SAM-binding protein YcdF (DUF218 family)